MRRLLLQVLLLSLLLVAPCRAWAQTAKPAASPARACVAGESRVDGVHCCFAGQSWSPARSACAGKPRCPKTMEVENETCVPLDKDQDEIPNSIDKCPDAAEDRNGYQDEDGCPDEPERLRLVQAAAQAKADAEAAATARAHAEEQARIEHEAALAEERRREAEARARADERRALWQAREQVKRRRRYLGYALVSAGAASLVVSGIFMGLGSGENSAIQQGGFATGADIASAASRGQTDNVVAITTGIVGGLGVAAGLPIVFASLPRAEPPPPTLGKSFFVAPTPGGVVAFGRF